MKRMHRLALGVLMVALALLAASNLTRAQQSTADIIGTVTDASGAVIPGATVTLTNVATNVTQTAMTTGSGDYTFTLLPAGTYSVKVASAGFKTYSAPNITVAIGDRARLDAKMEVGEATQTVEVSGVAPALQTDTSTIGTLVTAQAVEDVPLNGRNFVNLVQLSAGVSVGAQNDLTSGNRPDDRRLSSEFTVNGQGTDINNNMIDGMDNNERFIGTIGVRPSVDAIQEVNVQTNLYDASVGRTAGGVVNLITKSGTNNFHGSAYEFFRNAVLNANPNYTFGGSEQPNPPFRQNQYGASIGGPIKKDKFFFFGDFERFKNAIGTPVTDTVPTLCERGTQMVAAQAAFEHKAVPSVSCPDGTVPTLPGDFSQVSAISGLGGVGAAGTAANIPAGALNPIGEAIFSMYPLPTNAGTAPGNYHGAPQRTQTNETYDFRLDEHISDRDSIFGRYSFNNTNTFTPPDFPEIDLKSVDPFWTGSDIKVFPNAGSGNFAGPAKQRAQGTSISYVHIFRPDLLLNLSFGYLRYAIQSLDVNASTTKNASNLLGIQCTATDCVNFGGVSANGLVEVDFPGSSSPYNNQFCYFTCNGNPSQGGWQQLGEEEYVPLQTWDNTYREAAGITWNKGAHSIKFGVALIRRQLTNYQSQDGIGTYFVTGNYTGTPGGDLLEGLSSSIFRTYYLVSPGYRSWEPSAYVQDDYRAKRWLTLNMGVRYDIFTAFNEKRGRISNWDPATGLVVGPSIPGSQQSGTSALVPTPYHDFAPRLGFAATLKNNLVVRGGYGISFFPGTNGSGATLRNQPFGFSFQCSQQVASGLNSACSGPLGGTATANYSTQCPGTNCPVGLTGGNPFSSGIPVPFLNVNQVFVPANCTIASCPNNPYQSGVPNAYWPYYTDPYLQAFNLQIQKEFAGNVLTVGYVGELGRHLGATYNPNGLSNYTQTQTPLAAQFPWLASTSAAISEGAAPWGTSSYNGLQTTLVRRFKSGLTAQINYTWSHALDEDVIAPICQPTISDSFLGFGNGPAYTNPCFYDNVKNPGSPLSVTKVTGGKFGSGNAAADVRNRLAGTFNYELPFGKSMTGVEGVLVKGWAVNGAFSLQSGDPYTITTSAAEGFGGGRPDEVCNPKSGPKTFADWGINASCFKNPTFNTYGTEENNQFNGPYHKDLDMSLFKDFSIWEQVHMQFRTEVFNLFNTPNFSAPTGQTFGFPTLGQVSSLNNNYNAREIQFALKLLF
jgi:Carboxypeptidase regulatory-like domain